MTEQNNAIEVRRVEGSNSLMGVTGAVDKADIISIAVVRYEEQLEQAKAATLRQIDHAKTAINDGEKALNKAAEAAVKAFDLATERELVASLKAAGFGAFEARVKLDSIDEPKRQIHVTVGISAKGSSSYCSDPMSRTEHLPFAGESQQIFKDLRAARQTLQELNKQLGDIHKRLSGIANMERKARAKLAETTLNQSAEGKDILAQMLAISNESMPRFLALEAK